MALRCALLLAALAHAGASGASLRHRSAGDVQPTLPTVDKMLGPSANILDHMSHAITDFGSRLLNVAKTERDDFAKEKSGFEATLLNELTQNTQLKAQNKATSGQISELQSQNKALQSTARGLEDENGRLRSALETVVTKVGAANHFVNASLDATDDSHSSVLEVVSKQASASAQKSDDEATSSDDSSAASDTADKDDDSGSSSSSSSSSDSASSGEADGSAAEAADDKAAADDSDSAESTGDDSSSSTATSLMELSSRHRLRRHAVEVVADSSWGRSVANSTSSSDDADAADGSDDGDSSSDDSAEPDDSADSAAEKSAAPAEDAAAASAEAPKSGQEDEKSEQLVGSLSAGLKDLAKQDKAAEGKMEKLFQKKLANFHDERKHALDDQKALNHTRSAQMLVQKKLKLAVKHLRGTKNQLEERLGGLGKYLQRLAEFVSQPTEKAESLIPTLPSDVTLFLQTERRISRREKASAQKGSSKKALLGATKK